MALPAEGGNVSGSITIDHDGTLADEITIVVTVNPGWKNTGVNATHGVIVHDTGDNYTLSGVTANTTVTAYFEEDGGEGAIEGEGLEEGQAEGEGAIEGDGESEGEPLIIEVCSATAPILITGEPDSTVISILEIPDNFSIVDIDVELDVSHPCVPDLRFELIAPDATTVMLIEHIGMGGILTGEGCPTQFLDTVLDDESPTSLPDGMEPYTGAFNIAHPTAGLLADFDGLLASGVWVLRVTNGFDLTGTLEDWCLRVTGEYLSEGEGQPEGTVEGEGQPEGTVEGEGQPEGAVEGEGQPEGTVEGEGQPEGTVEGEGQPEGTVEGEGQPEGTVEGEGQPEGTVEGEGQPEGTVEGEGQPEGMPEGVIEGTQEGMPEGEGIAEGTPDGEGQTEGTAEGEGQGSGSHTADQDGNGRINLTELLRVIQFFNIKGFQCVTPPAISEDGYLPGPGPDHGCAAHHSDYNPQDWQINLTELLRLIQFFNTGGYHACPDENTEDGFCPIVI
jgi:subtilisin-like proprotein convertase family protein